MYLLGHRLAVVVSHENGYKLFEIPKIVDGKGQTIAKAVYSVYIESFIDEDSFQKLKLYLSFYA